MFCYGPLVSELGGRVHGAPQPRHWGAGAPLAPGSAAYGDRPVCFQMCRTLAIYAGTFVQRVFLRAKLKAAYV